MGSHCKEDMVFSDCCVLPCVVLHTSSTSFPIQAVSSSVLRSFNSVHLIIECSDELHYRHALGFIPGFLEVDEIWGLELVLCSLVAVAGADLGVGLLVSMESSGVKCLT